jgi:hypothetical protein
VPSADELFNGNPPSWITDFILDPVKAVSEMLSGAYYFGPLNAEDPAQLLLDWLSVGVDEFTSEKLDQVLLEVVQPQDLTPAVDGVNVQRGFWTRVLQLVVQADLPKTLAHVRPEWNRIWRIGGQALWSWVDRMTYMVIREPRGYYIQPEQIDTSKPFLGQFHSVEREKLAAMLVEFCQNRGTGWSPASLTELSAYYDQHRRQHRYDKFSLRDLDTDGFIVLVDGAYWFTGEFVNRCLWGSQRNN